MILGVLAVFASGCGDEKPKGGTDAPISAAPPAEPDEAACAAGSLTTQSAPDDLIPAPGKYSYRVDGERGVPGQGGSLEPLPSTADFVSTESVKFGNVECFSLQRKLDAALADTSTIGIRGADAYVTTIKSQAGGQITELQPNPPILLFSGDELEWEGTFQGATSGRYASEVIGRKTISTAGKRFDAIGVRTEMALSGEIEGTETVTRWLSTRENLVLVEQVLQRRKFGVDTAVLRYRARLAGTP